jgi:F-type H+-transporting ATPase subunit epsilon
MAEQQFLELTISRVDGPVFSGPVMHVVVPGVEGEMTILANHAPLISPLRPGTITILDMAGNTEQIAVEQGTFEVSNNTASILM